jgi:hypothetical protein
MKEQELIDRLVAVFKNREAFVVGKVSDVTNAACTVSPINGGEKITGVRYAVEESGVKYTPKVGALALVAIDRVNKMQSKYYLVMCSKFTSIQIAVDGANQLYSMAKTETLIEELNKTNAVLSAILTAINSWAPVPNDGGAAFKTLLTSALSGKQIGNYSGIKNENVKHG